MTSKACEASIRFMKYPGNNIFRMIFEKHKYAKPCKTVKKYYAIYVEFCYSSLKMPCSKEFCKETNNSHDPKFLRKICKQV